MPLFDDANDQAAQHHLGYFADAPEEAGTADDGRRDGERLIARTRGRLGRGEARDVDHARQRRAHAGNDKRQHRVPFDVDARKPRRLLVTADGVQVAARLALEGEEREPQRHQQRHQNGDGHQPEQLATKHLRKAGCGHGTAVRQDNREAAEDALRTQRDDERVQVGQVNETAVDGAQHRAQQHDAHQHGRPCAETKAQQAAADHAGQRHCAAHRQINAAQQNGEKLAARQQNGDGALLNNLDEVFDRHERLRLQNAEHDDHQHHDDHRGIAGPVIAERFFLLGLFPQQQTLVLHGSLSPLRRSPARLYNPPSPSMPVSPRSRPQSGIRH